ncbi:MAG TPA: metallophosphoesterase [Gemmatimonadales bacterium]|nr:metallophosphoesterase [Gemmatimonadales bacterium]
MAGQPVMPPGGWDRVGKALGVPGDSCAQKYRRVRQGATVATQPQIKPPPTVKDVHDYLPELPPKSFAVPIPKAAAPVAGKPFRAVVFGDSQIPFHDPACLAVVEAVIKDVQPHALVHVGDVIDAYEVSDYDKDPARLGTLQKDINATRAKLHQWAQLAPKARRVLLEGNHEDRLRRAIWRIPGAAHAITRLDDFQRAMCWPSLLRLDEIGWEWIPTAEQSQAQILPKLIVIHGHQVSGGTVVEGGMARKAIQKFGRSAILGHGHRASVLARRDHNGQTFGIETGCTCLLDGQSYIVDPNWQQAVTVIEWTANRRIMAVTQVHIRDGRALWRGTELAA